MLHYENMNVENHPAYIQVRRLKKDNIQITKKIILQQQTIHMSSQQMMHMIYFFRYVHISVL